jgi:hypothetical protein
MLLVVVRVVILGMIRFQIGDILGQSHWHCIVLGVNDCGWSGGRGDIV